MNSAQFSEVRILLSIVRAGFARWKTVIPSSAPIVIEICLNRIRPRRDARVVPQKILAGSLVDKVKDLRANGGKYAHLKQIVPQPD